MHKTPTKPKMKNSSWVTNKEVEHREPDRLAAATEEISRDRVKKVEEEKGVLAKKNNH